jgi:methylthioribose-1-phosphate isomerase
MAVPVTLSYVDFEGKSHLAPGATAAQKGFLDIIDQTLLPGEQKRLLLETPEAVYEAIKQLRVRGAPAIGCSAAIGLAVCAQRFDSLSAREHLERIRSCAAFLDSSRPTAVNLSWALKRCLTAVREGSIAEMNQQLLDEALAITAEDIQLCEAIGAAGKTLLKPGMGVLTHCNAGALATAGIGTALAPIYAALKEGISLKVYSDETRPLLQGARLTAWELAESGVDVTTICDSMASQVMREGKVDIVIVGADRVAANGDTANKIGTYQLAIAAKYHKVPFYVALPFSTIDRTIADGAAIPIEQRKAEEIFHCSKAQVYNPAFDVTPRELITGFITERGVLTEI